MLLVADNITVTNPVIEKALEKPDPEPVRELVRRCEAAGADAIDLNTGPLGRDPEKRMRFLVETVQEITDVPLLIDTANPVAMEAGLRANTKTAIINAFSLEPVKLEAILPLAKKYGADIIGFLLLPNGQVPPDADTKLSLATRLYEHVRQAGIGGERLIVDPVLPPVMWHEGNRQAMEAVEVVRLLPDVLGFPVRTIGGLSNLTAGDGGREKKRLLERTYLPMLAASGLSMVLLNVLHRETVAVARACNALISPKVFTWHDVG